MKTIVFLAGACLLFATSRVEGQGVFYYTSSPDSYIGQGKTETLSSTAGYNFEVNSEGDQFSTFTVTVYDQDYRLPLLSLYFQAPDGQELAPGLYTGATKWGYAALGTPGITFYAYGRAYNDPTGGFNVRQLTKDNGVVTQVAIDWSMMDGNNQDTWNAGSFRYDSTIPITLVPEPTSILLLCVGTIILFRRKMQRG